MAITRREMEGMSYEDIALPWIALIWHRALADFPCPRGDFAQLKPLLDTAKNKRW